MAGDYGKYSGKFPGAKTHSDAKPNGVKVGSGMGARIVGEREGNGSGAMVNDLGRDTNSGPPTKVVGLLGGESKGVGNNQDVKNLPPKTHTAQKSDNRENYIKKISMDY